MHSVVEGHAGVEDVQLRIHGSFPIPWKEGTELMAELPMDAEGRWTTTPSVNAIVDLNS